MIGFANLAGWPILRSLGSDEFRKVCVVCVTIMSLSAWLTVWTQEETEGVKDPMGRSEFVQAFSLKISLN